MRNSLNVEQSAIADSVIDVVMSGDNTKPYVIYLDGPGGSRKTYTYNYLKSQADVAAKLLQQHGLVLLLHYFIVGELYIVFLNYQFLCWRIVAVTLLLHQTMLLCFGVYPFTLWIKHPWYLYMLSMLLIGC